MRLYYEFTNKIFYKWSNGWLNEKDKLLETADLISGRPFGLDHVYYEKETVLKVGIWRPPYTEYFEDYQYDEFMYLLEGSVTVNQNPKKPSKGDAFLLPKASKGIGSKRNRC